ncbi:MAG: sigma-70 family RNA polymerase sigma factor [Candidatus Zixiibacteriota bacterium]
MEDHEESRQLVASILAGDTDLFQAIIEQHQKLVAHIVFRMVENRSDREDVCQDVFVKVYRKLASFSFNSKLSTWIATIAYNTCVNYLEKKKVPLYDDVMADESPMERVASEDSSPYEKAEAAVLGDIIRSEIAGLPAQYRMILALYHLEDLSYKEISDITRLPDGTVKSHLFRARKLLKDRLMVKYSQEDLCQ